MDPQTGGGKESSYFSILVHAELATALIDQKGLSKVVVDHSSSH